jgi:hypothetical protein
MATPARPQIDSSYFFQQLAHVECSTLVLDFDTTLPFATPRRSALPLPSVQELIECILMAPRTRVIVTSTHSVRHVLKYFRPPYPEIWGYKGRERMPAAATAAASVSFCIPQHQQTGAFSRLLLNLCAKGLVAYVVGERTLGAGNGRLSVRPEFHLSPTEVSLGGAEELVQFLTDWLRACASEIC